MVYEKTCSIAVCVGGKGRVSGQQTGKRQARARTSKVLNVMELGLHPEDEALEVFNQAVCNQSCLWKEAWRLTRGENRGGQLYQA